MTHNTEIEAMVTHLLMATNAYGYFSEKGITSLRQELGEYLHHQLQKARGGDIHFKVTEYGTKKVDNMIAESVQKARETLITEVREMLDFEGVLSMSVEKGFQEIIDRYHSELDQDKK